MTRPVDGFFQSIQPIVDQIVTTASHTAVWWNRTVQDLTNNLPPNVVPVAQLALTVAPFLACALVLPRNVAIVTLGVAAAVGYVAIRR